MSDCLKVSLTGSSAVGNAIVFPLDLATTRLQHASPDIRKKGEPMTQANS